MADTTTKEIPSSGEGGGGVRTQTVVLLRHGVARHNFHGANLTSPSLLDPSLTVEGKISAVSVGERIQHWWQRQTPQQDTGHVELVVCSPLSRTLQTASLAFLPDPEDPHPVPIVCIENVREAYGMHYPDKRRERSTLVKQWPGVQFDTNMQEADTHWSPTQRETWEDVAARIQDFLTWLCTRPERNICVVSHGVWIETCLHTYCPGALGDRRVYNCDAYAVQLTSRNGKVLSLSNATLIS